MKRSSMMCLAFAAAAFLAACASNDSTPVQPITYAGGVVSTPSLSVINSGGAGTYLPAQTVPTQVAALPAPQQQSGARTFRGQLQGGMPPCPRNGETVTIEIANGEAMWVEAGVRAPLRGSRFSMTATPPTNAASRTGRLDLEATVNGTVESSGVAVNYQTASGVRTCVYNTNAQLVAAR